MKATDISVAFLFKSSHNSEPCLAVLGDMNVHRLSPVL